MPATRPFQRRRGHFGEFCEGFMFRQGNGTDVAREIAAIERLLRELQASLGRLTEVGARTAATRASAAASGAATYAGDAVGAILNEIAERFLGSARSVTGEAAKLTSEAAKFGNNTLRKIGGEVENRPFLALAIAAGIGLLIAGAAVRRR
jgi:ElaB/YqjD/DUF883 family membrane-anchored ribosome-binding protein